jgi:acetolactate synthase-1/2/3 large subunit
MTFAEREAQALSRAGVPFLTGVPGSGPSYELLDACERAGMPFVPVAHEAAGVIIAGAAARQCGRLGAALSIKGPGVANLAGGVALARFENYPVITFAEAYAPGADPGLQHKRMPQDEMLFSVAKGIFYRHAALEVDALAALARAEAPGPVHLNLVEGPPGNAAGSQGSHGCDLGTLIDRVRVARRPVVICGSAATRLPGTSVTSPALTGFGVPVFSTAAAKGVIDEREAASAGVYTGAGAELAPESAILAAADLVIGIGLRNTEVLGARPFAAPYVSADTLGPEHQAGFLPALHHAGQLSAAIEAIRDAVSSARWGFDEVARAHAAVAEHLDRAELLPAACYATLARIPGTRLVTDSGNFTIVAEHVWRAAAPGEFVGSSNGRFMGVGVPQAIGVALQDSSRPTILTTGDGGLPPFIAEVRVAVERRLPLLIVLMSDGYFGSMRARVVERGFTNAGIRVSQPSWCAAVGALGCDAVRVTTHAEFESAVARWIPARGPAFIEAVMPDTPYVDMVRPLRR